MEPVSKVSGIVAPLDRADIDTDQIIPKQFLKRVERTGYGAFLFYDWRFEPSGEPRSDFILNQAPYTSARVLVAGRNFGCGSSREHAVWALDDFGIGAVIAPSFADIFYSNAFQSGLVPVVLDEPTVSELMQKAAATPGYEATVDVASGEVRGDDDFHALFDLPDFRKRALLEGLDDIGLTLQHEAKISEFERIAGPPSWA